MSTQMDAGAAGGTWLRRRVLLVTFASASVFLLVTSVAWACTTYWGQTTIENITTDSGEFTVVADPSSGMDRCDDADNDGDQDGEYDPNQSGADEDNVIDAGDGDTIRVEISKWEPGGQDSGNDCDASNHGGSHSLASDGATDDSGTQPEPVYINSLDGTAYDDKDGDGSYEDYDDSRGTLENASNEKNGQVSDERVADCMGDGSDSNETNYKGPDGTHDAVAVNSDGEFDKNDDDVTNKDDDNGDGNVNSSDIGEVDITFSTSETSGTPQALCVSEGDGGDSAPQIPIETT